MNIKKYIIWHFLTVVLFVVENMYHLQREGLLFAAERVTFCRKKGYFLPQEQVKRVTFCRRKGYFLPQALFICLSESEYYNRILLLINNLINNSNKLFNELFNKERGTSKKFLDFLADLSLCGIPSVNIVTNTLNIYNMDSKISGRKIMKSEGNRPEYIFDIIKDDPKWIGQLIDGKTFHGQFQLNDMEKDFYELIILDCPKTGIRLNIDDLKQKLAPYYQEPIFQDEPLQRYTEELFERIESYNQCLSNGFNLNPFSRTYSAHCYDAPYGCSYKFNNKIHPVISYADMYIDYIYQRLQGIRQKYKKGKLNQKLFESEERLKQKICDMRSDYNAFFIESGEKLRTYFDDWKQYREAKNRAYDIWNAFYRKYHYRGEMNFGRYTGKSISQIIKRDCQYITWALKNKPGFTLKGDDLEEYIEKTGYNPTTIVNYNTVLPSNPTLIALSSLLGGAELDSVVFKVSTLPDTMVLVSLTERYPSLRYNIASKGDSYIVTISGDFNHETEKIESVVTEEPIREVIFKEANNEYIPL